MIIGRIEMHLTKTKLVTVIALVFLALWVHGQWRLRNTRHALEQARVHEAELRERVNQAATQLQLRRDALAEWNRQRDCALVAVARAEQELEKAVPDSRWAEPPAILPEWNKESPYVWLRKEIVPMLSVPAFSEDGSVRREVAAVLNADDRTRVQLNESLRRLLHKYQELEIAGAEFLEEPLPGLGASGPAITVKVKPLPEEGTSLKQEFDAELRRHLGDQRTELLLQTAAGWLNSKFGSLGDDAKTISVARHEDGAYSIAIKFAGSWMSVGGVRALDDYIPRHLLPLFKSVTESTRAREPGESDL